MMKYVMRCQEKAKFVHSTNNHSHVSVNGYV